MPIDVSLTLPEMHMAATIGALRHIESIRQRATSKFGANLEDSWSINIEGAAGELATAKALNLHWGGPVNTYRHGGDVGDLQVRTRSRHDYDLIIRSPDRDTDIFILVTGRAPDFRIHGYIRAAEAKQPQWLHRYGGRPAAYFVPQTALHPIQALTVTLQPQTAATHLRAA